MPATTHIEEHFTASATVRDIVIGMSDGLTVPFALAAGLSGATDLTAIIVTAGVAEIAAGSIAMGLGGYLAAKGDSEHYETERRREQWEVDNKPEVEAQEVRDVFLDYGLTKEEAEPIVTALRRRPQDWINFMMRFELGLEKPDPARARNSAATIAVSYIVGGLVPLTPYIFMKSAHAAFGLSVLVTLIALGIFGAIKGYFTGTLPWRGALQTTVIGGLAAAAAYGLARAIGQ
ncbi:MAG: VIT1/CCC1 transporter family protein [Planctomycetota bacterium]